MSKHQAAVALGKLGGRVRSDAKAAAARENGKKGGRRPHMQITLIPVEQINTGIRAHYSVAEAARALHVSEASIRRAAKRAGVRRIAGSTVRGGILIDARPVPIVIAYAE